MTTKITAACVECRGSVELTPDDVTLYLTSERKREFAFSCSLCGRRSLSECPAIVAVQLKQAGVRVVPGPPGSDVYPEAKNVANVLGEPFPVFTNDDLIDFHFSMDEEIEALFDEAEKGTRKK